MGFSGTQIVVRSGRPPSELLGVQALGGELDWEQQGAGDWWLCRIHGSFVEGEEQFEAIVHEVGDRVLMTQVLTSDFALVVIGAPDLPTMEFVLNEDSAQGYGYPVDPAAQAAAPSTVAAWAGAGADAAALRAAAVVVVDHHTFAEEGVVRLAAAFGAVPAGELHHWVGDD